MTGTKKELAKQSTKVGDVEIQHMDSHHLSTVIDEGSETSMTLLDRSAQHLFNLMHSQLETHEANYLDNKPQDPLKYEVVDKIVDISKELRETIKLKGDMLRLKKDIIKDLRRN